MILLEVTNIVKHYQHGQALLRKKQIVSVLQDITFSLHAGECIGLVGQSGSGKSTLSRIILGLEKPTSGTVQFDGVNLYDANNKEKNSIRRDLQAVFQNSLNSFNPKQTIAEIIEEPLLNFEQFSRLERQQKVAELLHCVELDWTVTTKYPSQLSGGQQQRVNIARAIAVNPKLIVLDEAISSLDMILQKHILQLLQRLQQQLNLSYIFISHDLNATRFIADRVLVMHQGQIVEEIKKSAAIQHPASLELYNAILPTHPKNRKN
ncbi:nickel import ATP-binding protein NikE [Lysinibacillus sp. NPDC048646]|uniref:nickel import ATP-binding protein NikE n=1 Tax=Lysinibacillus sp. NPDC048646 TaxID=3390574 RepID=UPI003D069A84